ncbi:MAG: hypothetical protein ACI4KA_05130 [Oscillospiraceae bacterium]
MNKYNGFLGLAVGGGFGVVLMLFILFAVSYPIYPSSHSGLSTGEMAALWVIFAVLALMLAVGATGCILFRKDKPIKPIAQVDGTHIGGLPDACRSVVTLKLYKEKITFEVDLNLLGTKRQEYNLSLEKIVSVKKIGSRNAIQVITQCGSITQINDNIDPDGRVQDCLLIEYMDKGRKSHIVVSLPYFSSAARFIKEVHRLVPMSRQENLPIEL